MIGTIAAWLVARNPAMTIAHARRVAKLSLLAVLLVLVAVLAMCTADRIGDTVDNITTTAEQNGARGAVIAGQNQTLDQLGDANDAERELQSSGPRSRIAYDECLRNNRNKPACARANPDAGE